MLYIGCDILKWYSPASGKFLVTCRTSVSRTIYISTFHFLIPNHNRTKNGSSKHIIIFIFVVGSSCFFYIDIANGWEEVGFVGSGKWNGDRILARSEMSRRAESCFWGWTCAPPTPARCASQNSQRNTRHRAGQPAPAPAGWYIGPLRRAISTTVDWESKLRSALATDSISSLTGEQTVHLFKNTSGSFLLSQKYGN